MSLLDEERFTRPAGWRTGEFFNLKTGHRIHYANVSPAAPKAVVVILQGLSEFTEKYYELSRDMLARDFAVWTFDWAYQGRSSRMEPFPMRRHSDGFDADLADLHKLISDHVLPAAQGKKLIMAAHSMGGHIGLRYLAKHNGIFHAAAFSAPMLGIAQVSKFPPVVQNIILSLLSPFKNNYMPPGKDWHEEMRKKDNTIFSLDPVRDQLQMAWARIHPELRVGNPTVRWVYEAIMSCRALQSEYASIKIPVMIGRAAHDTIIDNDAIKQAAVQIPHITLIDLPDAHHEIFMERDAMRTLWFDSFDKLLQTADIL